MTWQTTRRQPRVVRSEEFVAGAMRQWGAHVWRLALVQAPTRADAEEVYQDVFMSLATDATQFAGEEHLKAWLLRVTVNRCRDYARRGRRSAHDNLDQLELVPRDPAPSAEDRLQRAEEVLRVTAAVRSLSPKLRVAVHLAYYEDLSTDEIAAVLQLKPSTVRVRLKRARDQLKRLLSDAPEAPEPRKAAVHGSHRRVSFDA